MCSFLPIDIQVDSVIFFIFFQPFVIVLRFAFSVVRPYPFQLPLFSNLKQQL